jgi:hypothetical protein
MPSIRLKSLTFDATKFRKLGDLVINVADRITLVAGHNGIGKSTILGLCANGSGIRNAAQQSYLNRSFQANLNEIVHLDYTREFEEPTTTGDELPSPILEYEVDGTTMRKRCALTRRTARREVRVVPRNEPHVPWTSPNGLVIRRDGKVPFPTLYLGMTRMLPIGESNPNWVRTELDEGVNPEDEQFLQTFISRVIGTDVAAAGAAGITTQSIKGTKKTAKHPTYPYSSKCISLGQDSLSAIATALASFKRLQREWDEYPGGLLVIDELDAGFHPHAQSSLADALRNAARRLNLQVLATTHSLGMIESVHPESHPVGRGGTHVDSVIYLTDTRRPRVAENYTLADIRRDMTLTPPPPLVPTRPRPLKLYLEDQEAALILKYLLTTALKRRVNREAGVALKPMPMSIGCGNLTGLMRHDPYFKQVLIVVDADATVTGRPPNVIKLPGARDAAGRWRSPEWTLHSYLVDLVDHPENHPEAWAALQQQHLSTDYIQTHLLNTAVNIDERVSSKAWLVAKQNLIEEWGIIELWLSEQQDQVQRFSEELVRAAVTVAPLL